MTKYTHLPLLLLSLILFIAGCPPSQRTSGNISMALQDYEQAVIEYSKGLEQEPDNVRLLTGLGQAHYNLEEYDEAAAAFQHATEVEDYPLADFYLGLTNIAQGKRQAGFNIFRSFRYTGKRYITESVREMAGYLEPQTELTPEEISKKMFRAWEDGLEREREAERPGK